MTRHIEDTNLIEEIKSLKISVGGKNIFPDQAKESVLRVINEQPTADVVEVKHGSWTDTGDKQLDAVYSGWKCSECGYIFCGDKTNYCGKCGAKMDGRR